MCHPVVLLSPLSRSFDEVLVWAWPATTWPEPTYDPLAFWLFPDWDSGPIEQPFWMRPLKNPEEAAHYARFRDCTIVTRGDRVSG